MKFTVIVLCTVIACLSLQCKKSGFLESAGKVVALQRKATSFHQINLSGNANVILTQDSLESIKVEAGEHLQPNIITSIDKGILTISNNTSANWLRNPKEVINVYVSVKNLDSVVYNGSGNITSANTITADKITFYSRDGAGNIDISLEAKETTANIQYESADFIFHGKSEVCYCYSNARGTIDFKDFEVKTMYIRYAGVRNAFVNVPGYLDAIIYHTGNVYYKGNPKITTPVYYSSGRVYPFN
jgi:hypothetical protein